MLNIQEFWSVAQGVHSGGQFAIERFIGQNRSFSGEILLKYQKKLYNFADF